MACSDSGYTNQTIGTQLIALLDSKTKDLAKGSKRLLHVDGHNSHITCELLDNALASNIEILGYPPHMTHLLQGLDVVNFGILKSAYYKQAKALYASTHKEPSKSDHIDLLIEPINIAFSAENIAAAWRKTGLRPINPDIIPSECLLGKGIKTRPTGFPGVPISSPISKIIGAIRTEVQMHHIAPLDRQTKPKPIIPQIITPFPQWPATMPNALDMLSNNLNSLSLKDNLPSSTLFNSTIPQKDTRNVLALFKSLEGTSAEFLTNPGSLKSSHQLPPLPPFAQPHKVATTIKTMSSIPTQANWEVLKEGYNELYTRNQHLEAKVILQEMHLEGFTLKLAEKEKPRNYSHLQRVTGLKQNHILSTNEVRDAAAKDKAKKMAEEVAKLERAEKREINKEATEWRKEATKRKKEKQAALNAQHERDCADARDYGMRRPKKPRAVPREATPAKYSKHKKGQKQLSSDEEGAGREDFEEEAQFSTNDDDSFREYSF